MNAILEEIYLSSLKLLEKTTLQDTYKTVVEEAVRLAHAETGTIFLGSSTGLRQVYSTYKNIFGIKPRPKGYTYQAYISGKARVLSREQIIKVHPELEGDIKTFYFLPLFYDGTPTGAMVLHSANEIETVTQDQIHTLQLFGAFASLAIRKTQVQYRAQKALETRDLFISMASHELKTPLTVIKLYVQMLYEKHGNGNRPESRWVENLLKETNRLIHLINELLHVDQVRTGKLKYAEEASHLKTILRNAIVDSQISYPDHVFSFDDSSFHGSDLVMVDSNKLVQVFINLLNNAAKFSPADTMVEVKLERKHNNIQVTVSDQGKGISSDEMKMVFHAYYKGKKNITKEGMGLGLSLVKRIVEQSKGTIHISSEVDKGTQVSVELPLVS